MGTPPESGSQGGEPERSGWQPQGWQSEWRQPGGWQGGTAGPAPGPAPPRQPGAVAGWQQAPDGSWHKTGTGTSSKATAALVFGILGLVLCPFVCSIVALVLGYQARREIDRSGGAMGGRGNATAGLILGWVGIALCLVFIVLIVLGVAAGTSITHDLNQPSPGGSLSLILSP
jgi:hypothetical protein